ncbi:hypothetical protein JCM19241_6154 [Vibrio ishigakensis]|uniref:Uncharacterized protein n=1 Tax=Vibrio ishigakensis TaxID=1481914 RepID=A0A0B8QTL8_9VIBR|nr:hypothetical protein JCM19241_6154 [Vibrio ishigakensis]
MAEAGLAQRFNRQPYQARTSRFSLNIENRALLLWKLDPTHLDDFAQYIQLSPPFSLAAINPITETQQQVRFAQWLSKWDPLGESFFARFLPRKAFYVIADIGATSGAEQGNKVEFKTFVSIGNSPPFLYRFASFKQIPGNDLLQLSTPFPSDISWVADHSGIEGSLSSEGYHLKVDIPLRMNKRGHARVERNRQFSEAYLTNSHRVFASGGAQSRYYFDGSSVSAEFFRIKQAVVSNTFPWMDYVSHLSEVLVPTSKMEFMVQPVTLAVDVPKPAPGPGSCTHGPQGATDIPSLYACLVAIALGNPEFQIPAADPLVVFQAMFERASQIDPTKIPTLYYALQDLYQGLNIFGGNERPKLFFTLLTEPKTIFVNFEIPSHKVKAFKKAFLPKHFELAKVRFYPEQKRKVYALSLNIYQSVGQNLNSFRAEWSTYVINPREENPKPRFSVLEAQTTAGGFDPLIAMERFENAEPSIDLSNPSELIRLIEPPNLNFEYSFDEVDGIDVDLLNEEQGILVDIEIAYPSEFLLTKPETEWMEANDFVYWGEVADILKYDQQVMFADLMVFEASANDRIIDTTFHGYVNPIPLPIIVWLGGQDIA